MVVAAAVFGVNLLPAFGPPTWAVLVLFALHGEYPTPALVLVGALAAAGGRLLLAQGTRRMRGRIPQRQRENLRAAGELVERRRWISESRFMHALNYCMLLPGPEAHAELARRLTRAGYPAPFSASRRRRAPYSSPLSALAFGVTSRR